MEFNYNIFNLIDFINKKSINHIILKRKLIIIHNNKRAIIPEIYKLNKNVEYALIY